MDVMKHKSRFQPKYVVVAIVVLIAMSFGGYYVYAKSHCIGLIDKRTTQIKNGEMLVQLHYKDGSPAQFVKRDVFLKMCMDDKFKL